MATIIVKSNASQATDVEVKDLGFTIPSSGGSETFTEFEELLRLQKSEDLRTFLTDDAHGGGSSTLILNDGTSDIAQAAVLDFLLTGILPAAAAPFNVLATDAAGEISDDVTFDGTATVTGFLAGGNIDANNNKLVGIAAGTLASDAVNKAQLDAVQAINKIYKELILSCEQLDDTNDAISQAIPFWLTAQPTSGNTFIITDGSTTETFTFLASESVAFDVAIGGTVADTMTNLVAAITADSTLWKAFEIDVLLDLNTRVVVIMRTNQSADTFADRIYGVLSTQAFGQYVNFSGEADYEISTTTTLPAADPAAKEFGFGRATATLIANETHTCRDTDSEFTWNSDDGQWESTGANGIVAGLGLIKTGPVLDVDFGEVGDIASVGTAAAAGVLPEAAAADHVHDHSDLSGVAQTHHDTAQVDEDSTLARVNAPNNQNLVNTQINTNFGLGQYVGKLLLYGQTVKVPNSGTLHLKGAGGVLGSTVGKRMIRAGTISALAVEFDAAVGGGKSYKLSIEKSTDGGTVWAEIASLTVAAAATGNESTSPTGTLTYAATDLLRALLVLTAGSGSSASGNFDATVEIHEG